MARRNIRTPMPIVIPPREGDNPYSFVALEDVYNRCLLDSVFLEKLEKAVEDVFNASSDREKEAEEPEARIKLTEVLLKEGYVLPQPCFDALFNKLINNKSRECLDKKAMKEKWPWDKEQEHTHPGHIGAGCQWPDCPDSAT